jgi:hypothetical protein
VTSESLGPAGDRRRAAEVPQRRGAAQRAPGQTRVRGARRCPAAAGISKRLRRERELVFAGDIDFIQTEEYSATDAQRAYEEAAWVLDLAARVIGGLSGGSTL